MAELLAYLGMTQTELAHRLGKSPTAIQQLLAGELVMSADLAQQLEEILGTPADFWCKADARYRQWLVV